MQMPHAFDEPAYRCITEAVRAGPWRDLLEPLLRPMPVTSALKYSRLLAVRVRHLDIWETVYHLLLRGPDPVAAWMRASALAPFLRRLSDEETRAAFYEEYRRPRRPVPYPEDRPRWGGRSFRFGGFLIAQGPVMRS
ncbi:hypothetical protein [Pararhodospirillum photometricum]|uniref:hypothetical protein n=1 Tax=Pararhodospirillum photometricum TaxID=1084 RepID=UPI0012FEA9B4|nr:hypothetical protein [Pararhodospirillum photometricum]